MEQQHTYKTIQFRSLSRIDNLFDDFQFKNIQDRTSNDIFQGQAHFFNHQNYHLQQQDELERINQVQVRKVKAQQKIKQNKLRRIQLELQKQQQKIQIMRIRRQKFQQLNQFLKQRNLHSDQAKQQIIKKSQQILFKQKQNLQLPQKQQLILNKIHQGRNKADQMRNTYAFRIHNKNKQRMDKVQQNRKEIESLQVKKIQKVHMKQWHMYQQRIKNKKQIKSTNPPDYLYQQHKQKQNNIKNLVTKHQQPKQTQKQPRLTRDSSLLNRVCVKPSQKLTSKKIIPICESLPCLQVIKRPQTNITKTNVLEKLINLEYFGLHLESKGVEYKPKRGINQKMFQNLKKYLKFQAFQTDIQQLQYDQSFLDRFQEYLSQISLNSNNSVNNITRQQYSNYQREPNQYQREPHQYQREPKQFQLKSNQVTSQKKLL